MANGKGWKISTIVSLGLSAVLVTAVIVVYFQSSTTVILLVRHAERDTTMSCTPPTTDNPPLRADGQTRANVLAHVGEDTGLQAVYASEFCRTQQTVQPIADQEGLTVTVVNQYSAGSPDVLPLVNQVKTNNQGQKVLIAGHTDTVPLIIQEFGGGTIDPIDGTEFDNLFVVTIFKWWFVKRTRVVRLKYGAPS